MNGNQAPNLSLTAWRDRLAYELPQEVPREGSRGPTKKWVSYYNQLLGSCETNTEPPITHEEMANCTIDAVLGDPEKHCPGILCTRTFAFLTTAENVQRLARDRDTHHPGPGDARRQIEALGRLWTPTEKIQFGGFLVQHLILASNGLLKFRVLGWNGPSFLVLNDGVVFSDLVEDEGQSPRRVHEPITEMAKEWHRIPDNERVFRDSQCYRGGYPDWNQGEILGRRKIHRHDDLFDLGEIPQQVLDALNHIQSTAWRINTRILDCVNAAWENDDLREQLFFGSDDENTADDEATVDDEGEDAGADDGDCTGDGDNEIGDRAERRRQQKREQREELIRRLVDLARKYDQADSIYFPHRLDFRGRVYPSPLWLQPQGSDLARGLLTFAKPEPLGPYGWKWLAVCLANSHGQRGMTFEERRNWAENSLEEIRRSAQNPLQHAFWREAKEPWTFLAACIEADRFWQHCDAGRTPEQFESTIPIVLDASCSGLQHLAALAGDRALAASVNVIRGDGGPRDMYQEVADELKRKLQAKAGGGNQAFGSVLSEWEHIGRKVTKKILMTIPYGQGSVSQAERVKKDILIPRARLNEEEAKSVAKYLVREVRRRRELKKMMEITNWLRELARSVSRVGSPIYWENPLQWRIRIAYERLRCDSVRVKNILAGNQEPQNHHDCTLWVPASKTRDVYDRSKAETAIVANFIHSLDAVHLMKTVNAGRAAGIDSLQVIHDAIGTHAGQTEKLHSLFRREFIDIYRENQLERFAKDQRGRLDWIEARILMKGASQAEVALQKLRELLEERTESLVGELDLGNSGCGDYLFG